MNYQLTPERDYLLVPTERVRGDISWEANRLLLRGLVTYVEPEELQGANWETFFTTFGYPYGDSSLSQERVSLHGPFIERIRIPSNSIQRVEGANILVDSEVVFKLIQSQKHSPIIQAWLGKVLSIRERRPYEPASPSS